MLTSDRQPLLYGGILFLLLICVATFAAFRISHSLQQSFDETLSIQIRKQSLFEDQIRMLQERFVLLRDIVTVEDAFDKDELIIQHAAMANKFLRLRLELESLPLTQEDRKLLELQAAQTRKGYDLQQELIDRSVLETDPAHYEEILDNIQPLLSSIQDEVLKYRAGLQESTKKEINLAKEAYEQGWLIILLFYIFAIVIGTIAVVWLAWRQRKQQDLLHWQATHDPLTELSNRTSFEHAIDHQIKEQEPGNSSVILYIDLDKFKQVNDSCGHPAGDELLIQLSRRIKSAVRHSDLVARIGGDEFGIVLFGCDINKAMRIADTVLSSINELDFIWDTKHFDIGASIGLAELNEHIVDIKQIIKQADAACYSAKDLGKNRIHVYSESDLESSRRITELERVNQIRYALDNQGFILYCQKIRPLKPNSPMHYEILLRLIDKDDSIITPDQFLPEAERYDLVTKIDLWVVQHTLAHIKKQSNQNEIYAINLSGKTLNDQRCQDNIVKEIDRSQVQANILCLEITETAAIHDLSGASSFLAQLRAMGCLVALDDFGTGLSSFSYLKQLPVDYLKIDGSFIHELEPGSQDYTFVKAIHSVSQGMGIQTIAEWVETPAVLSYLEDMQIDFAQGYHIGKPEPLIAVS
jgi:diguanylate cyclase (GGDEF)-like protein